MFNLKPCPFCNGNAIWNSRVVDGNGEYSEVSNYEENYE